MSFRTASEFLGLVLVLGLVSGVPIGSASAQDDRGNQQTSGEQDPKRSENDQQSENDQPGEHAQANIVQLKIIPLKHISYGELRNMMRLQDANYLRGAAEDEPVRLSHDGASNTLFIRGSKQRLDQIEQFISRMDVPADQLPQEIAFGDQAIGKAVSREVGERALPVLEQLGYPVSTEHFGDQRILVIRSDKQAVRDEVTQVIERFAKAEQSQKQQQQVKADGDSQPGQASGRQQEQQSPQEQDQRNRSRSEEAETQQENSQE